LLGKGCTGDYRFGFNGMEKDDEVSGNGNQYDYGFRIYNPRIAKFLSVDPLTRSYPMLTPYQFASNTPVWAIDLDGLEAWPITDQWSYEHIALFNLYCKAEIKKMEKDNIERDCATVAIDLLIGFAKENGLPLVFNVTSIGTPLSSLDEKYNYEEHGEDAAFEMFIKDVRLYLDSEDIRKMTYNVPIEEAITGDMRFLVTKPEYIARHTIVIFNNLDPGSKERVAYSQGGGHTDIEYGFDWLLYNTEDAEGVPDKSSVARWSHFPRNPELKEIKSIEILVIPTDPLIVEI